MRSRGYARRVERCVVNRAVIVYRVISSDLNNNINLVGSRVLEARLAFSISSACSAFVTWNPNTAIHLRRCYWILHIGVSSTHITPPQVSNSQALSNST